MKIYTLFNCARHVLEFNHKLQIRDFLKSAPRPKIRLEHFTSESQYPHECVIFTNPKTKNILKFYLINGRTTPVYFKFNGEEFWDMSKFPNMHRHF